eukprot:s539_g18.t3
MTSSQASSNAGLSNAPPVEDPPVPPKVLVCAPVCGQRDVLGETVKAAAAAEGLVVEVRSVDVKGPEPADLSQAEPFSELLKAAIEGNIDGGHAGPPCGSFSRARWNDKGHGPPPVRDKWNIYGLGSNNIQQQRDADMGTILAVRSCQWLKAVLDSQKLRKVPEVGTLENPPGSQEGPDGPMWLLPEVMAFERDAQTVKVSLNTCAYQMELRNRWWKPAMWAGRLEDLESLEASCSCPPARKAHGKSPDGHFG